MRGSRRRLRPPDHEPDAASDATPNAASDGGADVDARDSTGKTALQLAAPAVRALLEAKCGTEPDATPPSRSTGAGASCVASPDDRVPGGQGDVLREMDSPERMLVEPSDVSSGGFARAANSGYADVDGGLVLYQPRCPAGAPGRWRPVTADRSTGGMDIRKGDAETVPMVPPQLRHHDIGLFGEKPLLTVVWNTWDADIRNGGAVAIPTVPAQLRYHWLAHLAKKPLLTFCVG